MKRVIKCFTVILLIFLSACNQGSHSTAKHNGSDPTPGPGPNPNPDPKPVPFLPILNITTNLIEDSIKIGDDFNVDIYLTNVQDPTKSYDVSITDQSDIFDLYNINNCPLASANNYKCTVKVRAIKTGSGLLKISADELGSVNSKTINILPVPNKLILKIDKLKLEQGDTLNIEIYTGDDQSLKNDVRVHVKSSNDKLLPLSSNECIVSKTEHCTLTALASNDLLDAVKLTIDAKGFDEVVSDSIEVIQPHRIIYSVDTTRNIFMVTETFHVTATIVDLETQSKDIMMKIVPENANVIYISPYTCNINKENPICDFTISMAYDDNNHTETAYYIQAAGYPTIKSGDVEVVEVQDMSTGATANHSCFMGGNHATFCWGSNDRGQIGTGYVSSNVLKPIKVGYFTEVAVGQNHTCGIDRYGKLYCWGDNQHGQLGIDDESVKFTATPTLVVTDRLFLHISAGQNHTCGVAQTGDSVYCWGDNKYGQLGIGTIGENEYKPVKLATNYHNISAGMKHTCAIRLGPIFCWGDNRHGQLGAATDAPYSTLPLEVPAPERVMIISAGKDHTCAKAVMSTKTYCWGRNDSGQLGRGFESPSEKDVAQVETDVDFSELASGGYHTCGRMHDADGNKIYCWGSNSYGQIGNGSLIGKSVLKPALIDISPWPKNMMIGMNHSCTLNQYFAYCWGDNRMGQLGDGKGGEDGQELLSNLPVLVTL